MGTKSFIWRRSGVGKRNRYTRKETEGGWGKGPSIPVVLLGYFVGEETSVVLCIFSLRSNASSRLAWRLKRVLRVAGHGLVGAPPGATVLLNGYVCSRAKRASFFLPFSRWQPLFPFSRYGKAANESVEQSFLAACSALDRSAAFSGVCVGEMLDVESRVAAQRLSLSLSLVFT